MCENNLLNNQWNKNKNIGLELKDFKPFSSKKVWWICNKGHEWETTIAKRNQGRNCPYCSGKKPCLDNCLSTINPELAKEWHQTKNENLTPYDVVMFSSKKVWWICKKNHQWIAAISDRSYNKSGCPYCCGRNANNENCLATINPELSKEWHQTKNENLTPHDVTKFSGRKVWWKCEKGHEWQATISNRSNGTKCKKCINHGTSEREIKLYYFIKLIFCNTENTYIIFHNTKKVEIDIYIKELNVAIEYDGFYYHNKKNKIISDINKNNFLKEKGIDLIRIREIGLQKISDIEFIHNFNKKEGFKNTLSQLLNYLIKNYKLNNNIINKIKEIKNIDFYNHKIPSEFFNFSLKKNNLKIKYPNIASEWNHDLNESLNPEHVTHGSKKIVYWTCKKDLTHIWKSSINNRTKGSGCPHCFNKNRNKNEIK